MNSSFYPLRYLFIWTAVLSTLYMTPVKSYTEYTFASLLFIAIDTFHRKREGTNLALWIIAAQVGFSAYLSYTYGGMMFLLFYAILFSLRLSRFRPTELVLVVLQWAAMNLVIDVTDVSVVILSNLMYLAILTVLWLIGHLAGQKEEIQFLFDSLKRNHYELDEARSQLIEYAKRVEDVAQMEERNRISKDIHDELGHQFIRIKMMMEATLLVVPKDLEKGMDMLYQIRDHLSSSMETMRKTVRKLKPDDHLINSFSLQRLAEDFTKDSGVKTELATLGQPRMLYPSLEVALYRNAQEALTNAVRHGHAKHIRIELNYLTDRIVMSVSNDGDIPDTSINKGLGMRGMEERLALVGGKVWTEAGERFAIVSEIPYEQQTM
jgi:two-component system, NarL family, sensor kinase